MLPKRLQHYRIILASHSPRRRFLLRELGLKFIVRTAKVSETFPKKLRGKQIAIYLSRKKAEAFCGKLKPHDLLLTADTVVWLKNQVLNKPRNYSEAVRMLRLLSGRMHKVFTAVCITTAKRQKIICAETKVFFKKLSSKEIDFYVRHYQPYDKAGAYGVQECLPAGLNPCSSEEIIFLKRINKIELTEKSRSNRMNACPNHVKIRKISGSYFNVMGLPLKELYDALQEF